MTGAHETPGFQHSEEYTLTLTFVVEGGARIDTARHRAERIAGQVASAAARLGGVVEVTARGGGSSNGRVYWEHPVAFAKANTRGGGSGLTRYIDPERERAFHDLAHANRASEDRSRGDRARRESLGCSNAHPFDRTHVCGCCYCRPRLHRELADCRREPGADPAADRLCPCGADPGPAADRCTRHTRTQLVPLPSDPPDLRQYVQLTRDTGGRDL